MKSTLREFLTHLKTVLAKAFSIAKSASIQRCSERSCKLKLIRAGFVFMAGVTQFFLESIGMETELSIFYAILLNLTIYFLVTHDL